jgi:hypothetical protein
MEQMAGEMEGWKIGMTVTGYIGMVPLEVRRGMRSWQ